MTRPHLLVHCAVGLCVLSASGGAGAQTIKYPPRTTSPDALYSPTLTKATVTALAQRIAALEVEDALLEPKLSPRHSERRVLALQLAGLRKRLAQLQPHGDAVVIATAMDKAIAARVPALEVQVAMAQEIYTNKHQEYAMPKAQLTALRKRLAAMRQAAKLAQR